MNVRPSVEAFTEINGSEMNTLGQQTMQETSSSRLPDSGPGGEAGSLSAQNAKQPAATGDEDVWARMIENSDNTANIWSEKGSSLDCSSMGRIDKPVYKFVKFRGEPMAHSMLPHLEGHTEVSVDAVEQRYSGIDRTYFHRFNAPRAHRPQGKAPWLHASCDAHCNLLAHLPKEDQFYLYSIKKVFSFPQRSVTERLLVIFIESCYPLMPIFDRQTVLQLYEAMYMNRPSSPLLFHAILFTACHFADPPLLLEAGFNSVLEAKVYFFRRAKILYFHDCEQDHMFVVQALILMTFWWMEYTEEKDMRFWVGCAVNLALSMGMNKLGVKTIDLAPAQELVWRRTFWTLFCREHTIAVALGLPFLLNLKDCDLEPLSAADFRDNEDHQIAVVSGLLSTTEFPRPHPSHGHVCLKLTELTMRGKHQSSGAIGVFAESPRTVEKMLLSLRDAADPSHSIVTLESMKDIVSRENFCTPGMMEDNFSVDDPTTWNRGNIFPIFLFLYHERVVILYYRRYERALVALQKADIDRLADGDRECISSDAELNRERPELGNSLRQIRANILQSAGNIIEMLDNLLAQGLLRYAPSHVNTSCFHALLSIAEEIVTTSPNTLEPQSAKQKYSKGLQAVEDMKNYWKMASWAHSMFKKLADDDFKALKLSADRRRRELGLSRLQSRIASRMHSPISEIDDSDLRMGLDFLDTCLNGDQDPGVNFNIFNDWQDMNPLEGWSLIWEHDRGGGC
ncbi:uncharacterized protein Z520_06523 [Fonsecaea multimorphosa CBS 102226]|uniref:Xylanolytic transcriptional activator regulatory domain-containing protein n=1 Tax=Fonsecaea multimorphosa CBS 102226 TaxID=1442371 RepID=A0A0D2H7B5_9EURO|nr:uncharacterized protein Z520_06523 [Fonsecaea multimorphosa CBS 102226]KIX97745.1 hypothetical protein Z520_06523 [Fonsecaea multimorphosa CBS 102226]